MHIPQALSLDQNNVTLCLTEFKYIFEKIVIIIIIIINIIPWSENPQI